MENTPNPGSEEAISVGCRCPIVDNAYGQGRREGEFIISGACPVHGNCSEA